MQCLIAAPMTSDTKKTTRQKNNKISKNQNFTAKTENLNLTAHSNNVKMHLVIELHNAMPHCSANDIRY